MNEFNITALLFAPHAAPDAAGAAPNDPSTPIMASLGRSAEFLERFARGVERFGPQSGVRD
ncbi:MAG TPA: hypothetical protein PKM48_00615, partial [Parvularculaceae bacterium]|nr:hypothetical protein [Parvularculaceae bacterium]